MLQGLLLSLGTQAIGGIINSIVKSEDNNMTDEQAEPIREAISKETGVDPELIRGAEAVAGIVQGVSTIVGIVSNLVSSDKNELCEDDVLPLLDAVDKESAKGK